MNANRPLAFVTDNDLQDDLLKLAAAAGCDLELVPDAAAARQRWANAPLVMVDAAAATQCAEADLARRDSVIVVASDPPSDDVFVRAFAVGAERVIELPGAEPWLVSALADALEGPASTSGKVLAVLSGRGGAGGSVFTAAVGITAFIAGRTTLIVDCDARAGGIDLVLGAEAESGLRWPDMQLKSGRVSASSLHAALPSRIRGGARMTFLSGTREEDAAPAPDAVSAVVEAGRRAGEIVVCDVSRDFGDAACAVLDRADLAIIVVPGEIRACASARLVASRLAQRAVPAQLIVRSPSPGGLLTEEIVRAVGVPLLTTMRPEPRLAQSLDRGDFHPRARGPLALAARTALTALDAQPSRNRPGRHQRAA